MVYTWTVTQLLLEFWGLMKTFCRYQLSYTITVSTMVRMIPRVLLLIISQYCIQELLSRWNLSKICVVESVGNDLLTSFVFSSLRCLRLCPIPLFFCIYVDIRITEPSDSTLLQNSGSQTLIDPVVSFWDRDFMYKKYIYIYISYIKYIYFIYKIYSYINI